MFRQSASSIPSEVALDRAAIRYAERDTYGSSALHGLDPSEIVCRLEESANDPAAHVAQEKEALRREILSGFIEYAFADGPDPEKVRERLAGFIQSFSLEVHARMRGPESWVDPATVRAILRKPAYAAKLRTMASSRPEARLAEWSIHLDSEVDVATVRQTISAIIALLVSEAPRWKTVVACSFAMAKAYHSHLLAGMSLDDIATLCGDKGRATPSDRIKRLHNRRVEAAGAKATHVAFQKSETTVRKYSAAQLGNSNRCLQKSSSRKNAKSQKRKVA